MGVINNMGYVNAFTSETLDFMFQSKTITNTRICEVPTPSPRIICGSNLTVGGSPYTVMKKLATGGFGTVFQVIDARKPTQQKKVLKVHSYNIHV